MVTDRAQGLIPSCHYELAAPARWGLLAALLLPACSDDATATDTFVPTTTSDDSTSSTSDDPTSSTSDDPTTSTSDSTVTDTGDVDGEPPVDCPALVNAPPKTTIDGLQAVPIDILSLDAQMQFDTIANKAHVDVTMTFQLGPDSGMPIFDLRQTIAEAALDGKPLAPALMASHDFGKGVISGFRILEQDLEACSEHALKLGYEMKLPDAPNATGFQWLDRPDGVYFDLSLSDLNPGRYLESYLPANLPFDRHQRCPHGGERAGHPLHDLPPQLGQVRSDQARDQPAGEPRQLRAVDR